MPRVRVSDLPIRVFQAFFLFFGVSELGMERLPQERGRIKNGKSVYM